MFHLHCHQSYFNPRSHEGSDVRNDGSIVLWDISIHAPTKGATTLGWQSEGGLLFQSTLPRRERRYDCMYFNHHLLISIHAPTKGATSNIFDGKVIVEISIHAPTKGATSPGRPPRPGDRISIHAPTKGATSASATSVFVERFQSTLPRRERPQHIVVIYHIYPHVVDNNNPIQNHSSIYLTPGYFFSFINIIMLRTSTVNAVYLGFANF